MTKPTIGRTVHCLAGGDPMAAIVTGVYDDGTTVDLTVMPRGSVPYTKVGVPFADEGEAGQVAHVVWTWPQRETSSEPKTNITETAVQMAISGSGSGGASSSGSTVTAVGGAGPDTSGHQQSSKKSA